MSRSPEWLYADAFGGFRYRRGDVVAEGMTRAVYRRGQGHRRYDRECYDLRVALLTNSRHHNRHLRSEDMRQIPMGRILAECRRVAGVLPPRSPAQRLEGYAQHREWIERKWAILSVLLEHS